MSQLSGQSPNGDPLISPNELDPVLYWIQLGMLLGRVFINLCVGDELEWKHANRASSYPATLKVLMNH